MFVTFKKIHERTIMDELIEKYMEGTLNANEQITFNQKLKDDAVFRDEVTFYEELKNAVSVAERQKIKNDIQQFEMTKPRTIWLFPLLKYAAILVFGGLFAFYYFNHQPNNKKIYNEYYQVFPNVISPKVRTIYEPTNESIAFEAYDQKDFEKAAALFSKLNAVESKDYLLFYEGLSLMSMDKHLLALRTFDRITTYSKPELKPYVLWHKALCYIKLENRKEATKLVKELSSFDNPQQNVAQDLLQELE